MLVLSNISILKTFCKSNLLMKILRLPRIFGGGIIVPSVENQILELSHSLFVSKNSEYPL